jgi:hypothetical protein
METELTLLEKIKKQTNINEMLIMQKEYNKLKSERIKNKLIFVLIDMIPKGYEKTSYYESENKIEIIFTKGFIKKQFICINKNSEIIVLKINDIKKRYTYQLNGQAGINTTFFTEVII